MNSNTNEKIFEQNKYFKNNIDLDAKLKIKKR